MLDTGMRYFVAVASCGSIRQAAAELHIAQSALSRQLAKLEHAYGVRLFERHARGVIPTDAGRILLRHARDGMQIAERVTADLDALKGLHRGTVKLHVIELLVPEVLPRAIALFSRSYPGIVFDVTVESTDHIVATVMEGRSDIGLVFYPPRIAALRSLFRTSEPLTALVHAGHPLAGSARVSLREAAAYPVGVTVSGTGSNMLVAAAFKARGLALAPALETNSTQLLVKFALQTDGIAFLSRLAAVDRLRDGVMVALRVSEPSFRLATIEAIVLATRKLPRGSERFLQVVESELRKYRKLAR